LPGSSEDANGPRALKKIASETAGTVIALVNPANPDVALPTTYTYDPSGNPQMNGTASTWPFLYHGMEHEHIDATQYYYSGNGAYYSAQLMRSMSTTSAQGRKTPVGDASGIVGGGGDGMALSGMTNAAALAADVAFQDPTEAGGASGPSGGGGSSLLTLFEIWEWGQFFGGGGSPDYPPNYWTYQHRLHRRHGGRHPLYTQMIGVSTDLVVNQSGIRLVSAHGGPSINPPLSKQEGNFEQVGYLERKLVMYPNQPPMIINNPDGSAAYTITCHKDGTIGVDFFNQGGGHCNFPGSFTLTFRGVIAQFVCHGYKIT
jgi:hypothetical protein